MTLRGIAQIMRSGWYRSVHIMSREPHYIRALLTSRKIALRKCTDMKNEIRSLFKAFGIRLPSPLSHAKFEETVRPIMEVNKGLSFALLPMLEATFRTTS